MAKPKPDPIFLAYTESAPLEDLRFYLRYAARHLGTYRPETRAVVAEMVALEARLPTIQSATTRKHLVWNLIDRFKASIPRWAVSPPAALAPEPLPAPASTPLASTLAATAPRKPSWRERAIAAEAALARIQQTAQPKHHKGAKKAVDWVSAGRKAWETRKRNIAIAKAAARKRRKSAILLARPRV